VIGGALVWDSNAPNMLGRRKRVFPSLLLWYNREGEYFKRSVHITSITSILQARGGVPMIRHLGEGHIWKEGKKLTAL